MRWRWWPINSLKKWTWRMKFAGSVSSCASISTRASENCLTGQSLTSLFHCFSLNVNIVSRLPHNCFIVNSVHYWLWSRQPVVLFMRNSCLEKEVIFNFFSSRVMLWLLLTYWWPSQINCFASFTVSNNVLDRLIFPHSQDEKIGGRTLAQQLSITNSYE